MSTPSERKTIVININYCARCHGDHEQLTFTRLIIPIEDRDGRVWSWWAACPTNGDPILAHIMPYEHQLVADEQH